MIDQRIEHAGQAFLQGICHLVIARLGPNNDLVLVLEDDRRWPCSLANSGATAPVEAI